MKIRPVGVELFHADGQTERHDKAITAFRSLENGLKGVTTFACKAAALCTIL